MLMMNPLRQTLEDAPDHNFSAMGEAAMTDLASFIREGQIDMRDIVDYDSKIPVGGDDAQGEELYMSTCKICHGEDVRQINFHDADDPEFVGNIAVDNPWSSSIRYAPVSPAAVYLRRSIWVGICST